jgi:hypothetical protein
MILNMRLPALGLMVVCCCPLIAQSIPEEIKASLQAVSDLSDQIKSCKASLYEESKWGSKANEIERGYLDTPLNVIWDAMANPGSLRAPYRAYIEFTSHYFEWVPPESKTKYENLSRPFNIHLGEWKFRYEFDVHPDSVKFTRAFVFYPSGRGGSEPFSRTDMCWDKWLRQSINVRKADGTIKP